MTKKIVINLLVFMAVMFGISECQAQNSYTVPTLQFKQGDAGTVGSIATIAASGGTTLSFDIGANWAQYNRIDCILTGGGASTAAAYTLYFGDSLSAATYRAAQLAGGFSGSTAWAPATTPISGVSAQIGGKYVSITFVNNDATNAFTSGNWYCVTRK